MGMRRRRMWSTSRMKHMDIYNIYIYIFDAVMRTESWQRQCRCHEIARNGSLSTLWLFPKQTNMLLLHLLVPGHHQHPSHIRGSFASDQSGGSSSRCVWLVCLH